MSISNPSKAIRMGVGVYVENLSVTYNNLHLQNQFSLNLIFIEVIDFQKNI